MRVPDGSINEDTKEYSKLGLGTVEAGRFAEMEMMDIGGKKGKSGTRDKSHTVVSTSKYEGKPLVLFQVNCRSIYSKASEFCNLVDTYNPDITISTESWLPEDIGSTELFRDDFTTFRRDRHTRGGGVFICVKNNIDCSQLWVDDDFEIIAVQVKGTDPK